MGHSFRSVRAINLLGSSPEKQSLGTPDLGEEKEFESSCALVFPH